MCFWFWLLHLELFVVVQIGDSAVPVLCTWPNLKKLCLFDISLHSNDFRVNFKAKFVIFTFYWTMDTFTNCNETKDLFKSQGGLTSI